MTRTSFHLIQIHKSFFITKNYLKKQESIKKICVLNNTKEVTKEKSAAIYSIPVSEVVKKRNEHFLRGTGTLEDSSGTTKGVVDARVTYEYNTHLEVVG